MVIEMKKKFKKLINKIPGGNKFLRYMTNVKRKFSYFLCKRRYKTDDKMVLFSSFWGKKYNCNPKGIYEGLLNNDKYRDYKYIWVFKNPKPYKFLEDNPNTTVVRLYSKKYYEYCARAKYFITNVSMPNWVSPKKDQIYINTWHGKPMKKIGCNIEHSALPKKKLESTQKGFKRNGQMYTYLFSAAPFFTEKMATAYGLDKDSKKVIEVGYPRNDFLFKYTKKDVENIKNKLGIDKDKKVIFYAPTWRNYEYDSNKYSYAYQNHLDFDKLLKKLGKDYVILFKAHNQEENSADVSNYKGVIDVSKIDDINELYIISDLMISDYSGAIFDYANLRRPMVYYMWDKDEYTDVSQGVDFDFDELPGEIVIEEDKLADSIKRSLKNFKYDAKYKKFNQKYNCLDGRDCGKKFIEKYIK